MEQRADLLNLLNYIPPSELDYQECISYVVMYGNCIKNSFSRIWNCLLMQLTK